MEFREGKIQNPDLAEVVDTVKRCIKTYDIVVTPLDLYFYYFPDDNPDLHECFESIRKELVPKGYIPFLSEETERFIVIRHRPEEKYRSSKVNIILFLIEVGCFALAQLVLAVKSIGSEEKIKLRSAFSMKKSARTDIKANIIDIWIKECLSFEGEEGEVLIMTPMITEPTNPTSRM